MKTLLKIIKFPFVLFYEVFFKNYTDEEWEEMGIVPSHKRYEVNEQAKKEQAKKEYEKYFSQNDLQ